MNLIKINNSTINNIRLLVRDGKCFPNKETPVANIRPRSAMTVNVNGMPINAKNIQNIRPPGVTGTMLPYPIKIRKFIK